MEITPSGISTLFIVSQFIKAPESIHLTLTPLISEGITTFVAVPTYLVIVLVSLSK